MSEKHFDLIHDRVTPFLAECLKQNIRTTETANVSTRITKKVMDMFDDMKFNSESVKGGLKYLFEEKCKEILDSAKVEVHKKDSENKFELIAHVALKEILDGSLFEQDEEWIDGYLEAVQTDFVKNLIKHYLDSYYQKIEFAMVKNWEDAELAKFGKEQNRYTFQELHRIIMDGNGFNAWVNKKVKKKTILEGLAEDYLKENKSDMTAHDLVEFAKACNWNPEFREYCMDKYNQK
jgi:hypothetical protein